eukprot:TRINITY_DN1953_c0_g1_i12.p1 TRINITY_DN1953_c0_g1~~TRINITY_DN1953_c0_g1_i12.p1  ORF type:complete len:358 (+),score=56.07 TRINITY_DN1953_c0_g1_i12:791-1864(+)
MLCHWLFLRFPQLYNTEGGQARHGPVPAAFRASNLRVHDLDRRCMAFKLPLGYFISRKDKQAAFTGEQQRAGVWFLAFFVADLIDLGCKLLSPSKKWKPFKGIASPKPTVDAAPPSAAGRRAPPSAQDEQNHLLSSLLLEALESDSGDELLEDGETKGNRNDDNKVAACKKVPDFDWGAYTAMWGTTPLHTAIPALFSEYALVVGRITGHLHFRCTQPMTKETAKLLGEMCTNFVLRYVNPVLGVFTSTTIHTLRCHIIAAIMLHGALFNSNTVRNESLHVHEKQRYCRANGDPNAVGYQLLRAGQGTLEMHAKHAHEEEQEWLDEEGDQWEADADWGKEEQLADGEVAAGGLCRPV